MDDQIYNPIIGWVKDNNIIDVHGFCKERHKDYQPINLLDRLGGQIFRHSGAHLLAHAITNIYQNVHFAIGPVTTYGSYYDVKYERNFNKEDFVTITNEMHRIIKQKYPIIRQEVSFDEARRMFQQDPLKQSILNKLDKDVPITIYKQDNFFDLCAGPHVENTGDIPECFVINTSSEITWRDWRLQRIELLHFATKKEQEQYTQTQQVIAASDHRHKMAQKELARFIKESPGCVLWDQYGVKLRRKLKTLILDQTAKGFTEIQTPPLYTIDLWKKTGHLDKYKDLMFIYDNCGLKPMNCPAHAIYFQQNNCSYKDLPYRIFEFGQCFRNEAVGGLLGCKRTKCFEQDDGHIFCTIDHISKELSLFLDRSYKLYNILGFNKIKISLSTRPEQYVGDINSWNKAESLLQEILEKKQIDFNIAHGEGAFYGPKIELHIQDHNNKYWQCGTLQVDFFLAKNLNITYTDQKGLKQYPVVLHRATLGSLERFLAIYIENNNNFIQEINPYPIVILPINISCNPDYIIQHIQNYEYIIDTEGSLGSRKHKWKHKNRCIVIFGQKEIDDNKIQIHYNEQQDVINPINIEQHIA